METQELIKRAEDLALRCTRTGRVTASHFLTPAEQLQLERAFARRAEPRLVFHGGASDCERRVAFFLPDWLTEEELEVYDTISLLSLKAHFGTPGHRDYLGALLGMGVGREWLGDIWVEGDTATVFCLKSVERHLLSIEQAGRTHLTARLLSPEELPVRERKFRELSFTVMSPRLDAVAAGLFHLSRAEAARQIALGALSINYEVSNKPDYMVHEGDIISLRGHGKGRVTGFGGESRKGRLFLYAELWQ